MEQSYFKQTVPARHRSADFPLRQADASGIDWVLYAGVKGRHTEKGESMKLEIRMTPTCSTFRMGVGAIRLEGLEPVVGWPELVGLLIR